MSPNSEGYRSHPFIHSLDDDSLLCLFNLCRPALLDEGEDDNCLILQGGNWGRERWWYKLAQVCQRWRRLVHAFASHLDLRLVCTHGTPVADMLAHSPPLPLIIDYLDEVHTTAEVQESVVLALRHRDRVRRIRLQLPPRNLQRLISAIDGEFPMLEYLYFAPPFKCDERLIFPKTFRAPHLRHLIPTNIFPIGSPLLMTHGSLVTLSLQHIPRFAYFPPNDLLNWLSHLPQLETLLISFSSPPPSCTVKRQLLLTPITTSVMLPNLRWFGFGGVCAYLEALLPRITVPLLEKFQILFIDQLTLSTQYLLQFMGTTEDFRCGSARFRFSDYGVVVWVDALRGANKFAFYMHLLCNSRNLQAAHTARFFLALGAVSSAVEHLILELEIGFIEEVDPARWYELLGSFSSVKFLLVDHRLIREISRSLQSDDGEFSTELLPELKVLSYAAGDNDRGEGFTAFVDARQNAGRPVTLSRFST